RKDAMRTIASEFSERLRALVSRVDAHSGSQTEALVDSVVTAGGTSETALVAMLRNSDLDSHLRADVCWVIARIDLPGASAVLLELLSDSSERVREEAAIGLGLVGSDEAVDALLATVANDASKA